MIVVIVHQVSSSCNLQREWQSLQVSHTCNQESSTLFGSSKVLAGTTVALTWLVPTTRIHISTLRSDSLIVY